MEQVSGWIFKMVKGYESVGDLIDEILDLKQKLRKQERENLESWISYLKLFRQILRKIKGQYNVDQHIFQLEERLEEIKWHT